MEPSATAEGLRARSPDPCTAFSQDLFPSVIEKAAALLHGLATTQHFVDGNKRTAWLACATYLEGHGLCLMAEADAYADDFVVGVAIGEINQIDVATWILDHLEDGRA